MAHIHGGAIHNHGTLKLVNVTITGNHANESNVPSLGGGGGIYNATTGTADLTNVTIADNDASVNAGGLAGTPMTLHNVLIVDNTGGNGNCDHAEIDDGGNLQFPAGACGVPVATLKPIGQLTDGVYRLPAGSEAIDHGTFGGRGPHTFKGEHVPTRCPAGDQIGTRRPLDGDGDGTALCDTGAIEFPPTGADVVHRPLGLPGRLHPVTLTFDTITSSGTSTLRIVGRAPTHPRASGPSSPRSTTTSRRPPVARPDRGLRALPPAGARPCGHRPAVPADQEDLDGPDRVARHPFSPRLRPLGLPGPLRPLRRARLSERPRPPTSRVTRALGGA